MVHQTGMPGLAFRQAFFTLTITDQMHGRVATAIKPIAGEGEWRAIAHFKAQHCFIKMLGGFKIRWAECVVVKTMQAHFCFLRFIMPRIVTDPPLIPLV
jgi:hypothetical protein